MVGQKNFELALFLHFDRPQLSIRKSVLWIDSYYGYAWIWCPIFLDLNWWYFSYFVERFFLYRDWRLFQIFIHYRVGITNPYKPLHTPQKTKRKWWFNKKSEFLYLEMTLVQVPKMRFTDFWTLNPEAFGFSIRNSRYWVKPLP